MEEQERERKLINRRRKKRKEDDKWEKKQRITDSGFRIQSLPTKKEVTFISVGTGGNRTSSLNDEFHVSEWKVPGGLVCLGFSEFCDPERKT